MTSASNTEYITNIKYCLENTSAEQDEDPFNETEDIHGLKYSTENSIKNPRDSMAERIKQSIIHSREELRKGYDGSQSFKCGDCSMNLSSKSSLSRHMKRKHNGPNKKMSLLPPTKYIEKNQDMIAEIKQSLIQTRKEFRQKRCDSNQSALARPEKSPNKANEKVYLSPQEILPNTAIFSPPTKPSDVYQDLHREPIQTQQPTNQQQKHQALYRCPMCEFSTTELKRLKLHKNLAHRDIVCSCCSYKTFSKADMRQHNKDNHMKVFCSECNFSARRRHGLYEHMNAVHNANGVRYPCTLCSYRATQKSSLNRHMKTVHMGLRYYCDICPFSATSPVTVKSHKLTVHEKYFFCKKCDFSTDEEALMQAHERTLHLDVGDFSKVVTAKFNFQTEVRHTCPECDYFSSNLADVEAHHTSAHHGRDKLLNAQFWEPLRKENFFYAECSYISTKESALESHKLAMHNAPKFPCYLGWK